MPISSGFYNSVNGDRVYDADHFGSLFNGIISDGIFPNVGDKFFVHPTGNGLGVYIGSGKAWINKRWVENTGDESVQLTAANASFDRVDTIALSVDNSKAVRGAKFEVIRGIPGAAPTSPILPNAGEKKYMPIADVRVIKNSQNISAENITNYVGSAYAPYISGPVSTINLNALEAKLKGEFDTWFASVRDALANAGGNTSTDVANLKASDATQNSKIEALEGKAVQFDARITSNAMMFDDPVSLFKMANRGNAGMHNAMYRGASLGTNVSPYMTGIRNGTFSNLYIGDYWTYGGVNWRVAAFNYFKGFGQSPVNQNHVVVIPDKGLYAGQIHGSTPFKGSYIDYEVNRNGLAQALRMAQSAFGSANVLRCWTRVSKNIDDNGRTTEYTWYNADIMLLDEGMVFGRGLMGAGPWGNGLNLGQLPLFFFNHSMITIGQQYWLRDRAHANTAVYINGNGEISTAPLTYGFQIRPYIVIG